jgi:hypothetical protein
MFRRRLGHAWELSWGPIRFGKPRQPVHRGCCASYRRHNLGRGSCSAGRNDVLGNRGRTTVSHNHRVGHVRPFGSCGWVTTRGHPVPHGRPTASSDHPGLTESGLDAATPGAGSPSGETTPRAQSTPSNMRCRNRIAVRTVPGKIAAAGAGERHVRLSAVDRTGSTSANES